MALDSLGRERGILLRWLASKHVLTGVCGYWFRALNSARVRRPCSVRLWQKRSACGIATSESHSLILTKCQIEAPLSLRAPLWSLENCSSRLHWVSGRRYWQADTLKKPIRLKNFASHAGPT